MAMPELEKYVDVQGAVIYDTVTLSAGALTKVAFFSNISGKSKAETNLTENEQIPYETFITKSVVLIHEGAPKLDDIAAVKFNSAFYQYINNIPIPRFPLPTDIIMGGSQIRPVPLNMDGTANDFRGYVGSGVIANVWKLPKTLVHVIKKKDTIRWEMEFKPGTTISTDITLKLILFGYTEAGF